MFIIVHGPEVISDDYTNKLLSIIDYVSAVILCSFCEQERTANIEFKNILISVKGMRKINSFSPDFQKIIVMYTAKMDRLL